MEISVSSHAENSASGVRWAVDGTDADRQKVDGTDADLLTPKETAPIVKLSVSTLKDKRWKGTGPSFIKLTPGRGGRIRYRRRDVEQWLTERQVAA
ncbi:helix-turn-helix domain-containing protein [Streptomyces sp. NPDC008139]|uniref:helix-turn-helix transcriptional regulator n=1 Tax=Streptomyces sp. NPDC008139 TaxID=3364814 RepID=UPI0036EDFEE2